MGACTNCLHRLLPFAATAMLVGCGGNGTISEPQTTHGAAAVEAAEQAAAAEVTSTDLTATPVPAESDTTTSSDSESSDSSSANTTEIVSAVAARCDADPAAIRASALYLVNTARSQPQLCGSQSFPATHNLGWNNKLEAAGTAHANDMASNDFFDHLGSDGLTVDYRVEKQGYLWQSVGENIAAGQVDTDEVMQGWMDSANHCKGIMNDFYTEVGVSCISSTTATHNSYWVMVLGKPLPTSPN